VVGFDDGSNRITSTGLSKLTVPTDYYESGNGNVQDDGSYHYLYDDDGRFCAIVNPTPAVGSVSGTLYIYDADGRRVAKGSIIQATCDRTAPGFQLTNTYILDQSGQQVSEVDGQGTWEHIDVYLCGQLLATYNPQGLNFGITDPLGTRRVQASGTGQVEQNGKSLPFGDSDSCFALGTLTSPTEHLFTGKERDTESGLDNFEAQYYGSSRGRFMSPDEPFIGSDPADPQSWNLYSYVRNNPLIRVDPDGHDCIYAEGKGGGTLQRGDCTNAGGNDDNGIYVNGHVDENSFKYNANNNSSSFSYTPDGAGAGTINAVFPGQSKGMAIKEIETAAKNGDRSRGRL
jgi:RHS repeat-associated protein